VADLNDSRHACPGHCGAQVTRSKLACRNCWWRLPLPLRQAVTAAYARRAVDPSAHRAAMVAAFDWYDADRDRRSA
jgi:hypothetical protein